MVLRQVLAKPHLERVCAGLCSSPRACIRQLGLSKQIWQTLQQAADLCTNLTQAAVQVLLVCNRTQPVR